MNKYAISTIVVIAVAVTGVFLLFRDGTENMTGTVKFSGGINKGTWQKETETKDETSTSTEEVLEEETPLVIIEEKTADVVVTYSDDGFNPISVTIKKGQTVEFVNESESERNMWPASNSHPSHTIYPEKTDSDCLGSSFDACERIAPEESWSFTFESVGSWKYHDHLKPKQTAIIIVE